MPHAAIVSSSFGAGGQRRFAVRLSPIALSFLLATLAVPSATFAQGPVAVTAPSRSAACPVVFNAEREGSLGLRATKNPNQNPGPGLDLSFHSGVRRVVEADITVYGWSKQLRMVPAAYPPETSESIVLNGTKDAPVMQSLVWMKRLGVVNSVELTRVVFSDGAAWAQSGHLHCTARPSKLVLVGASAR
jgi:hypothetical protein